MILCLSTESQSWTGANPSASTTEKMRMNLQRNPQKEAQALIPDLLPDLVPAAVIAERFREVTIGNLRRMTAARWGTPTENTMALPLDRRQEDQTADPGIGLHLGTGDVLPQDQGTEEEPHQDQGITMTQDPGIMIPGDTPVVRGVKWNTLEEAIQFRERRTTIEKVALTSGTDRHQGGGLLLELRPEDRHQDQDDQDRTADMEALLLGRIIEEVPIGLDP